MVLLPFRERKQLEFFEYATVRLMYRDIQNLLITTYNIF